MIYLFKMVFFCIATFDYQSIYLKSKPWYSIGRYLENLGGRDYNQEIELTMSPNFSCEFAFRGGYPR
jgi:hypothetical protein